MLAWNPNNKGANVTLSDDGLSAVSNQHDQGLVMATGSHAVGKRCLRARVTYPTSGGEECFLGVVKGDFDTTPASAGGGIGDGGGSGIACDGWNVGNGNSVDMSISEPSGGSMRVFVNFDTGKIWFGNEQHIAGDPEAGTGEAFTFVPNTPLFPAAYVWSDAGNAVVTLDPGYSDLGFDAW